MTRKLPSGFVVAALVRATLLLALAGLAAVALILFHIVPSFVAVVLVVLALLFTLASTVSRARAHWAAADLAAQNPTVAVVRERVSNLGAR